ncbi:MAG: hypothetical protein PUJ39_09995 [Eubacteriales bacterium]|nr:hypothetical protein [Eubacteriales bacterium]
MKLFPHFDPYFMPFRVVVGVGIQIEANDGKPVFPIKRNGAFIARLSFQHDHPRACGLRRFGDTVHERRSQTPVPPGRVEHADIADSKTVVPAFYRAFHKPDQLFALKRAESDRGFQPLSQKFILEGFLHRRFQRDIFHRKTLF